MYTKKNILKKLGFFTTFTASLLMFNMSYAESVNLTQDGMHNASLESFENIEISTSIADIKLEPGMAFAIEILNDKDTPINYSIENGKLIVKQKKAPMFNNKPYVKVYYPANSQFNSVALNSAAGDIDFENGAVKQLSVANVSGDSELDNITVEDLEMNSVSGNISADKMNIANDFSAANISGKIDLEGVFNGKTKITTVSGNIEVDVKDTQAKYNLTIGSISGKTSVNDQKIKGEMTQASAQNTMKINSTSGAIDIDFLP